jgi:hypothetical protein
MKRTVMLTATALMFAGMTSLSLAGEHKNTASTTPSASGQLAANPAPAEAKPVANVEAEKQPATMNGKTEVAPSKESSSSSEKVAQSSPATPEKNGTEKKEASATASPEVKDKKAEQKPIETPTATNPTK